MVDALIISEHVNSLNEDKKNFLKEKAGIYLESNKAGSEHAEEYFNKPDRPCPALGEDGECTIYEGRPVICRKFGPPVYDYKNPEKLFACVLNFKDGEEIIDKELIPNQTQIGVRWDKLKTEFNIENGYSKDASTTIADAIRNS
jgi:Fe-S-cluster containining protein